MGQMNIQIKRKIVDPGGSGTVGASVVYDNMCNIRYLIEFKTSVSAWVDIVTSGQNVVITNIDGSLYTGPQVVTADTNFHATVNGYVSPSPSQNTIDGNAIASLWTSQSGTLLNSVTVGRSHSVELCG